MSPDGTPPDPIEALRAALGAQYAVERLLGLGGMGSVYLARDLTLDRPVAIKVINQDIAANATLRERFLQEARTVARLRHHNIVPVYAAGESNGILYFVMEYVPGESLRDVLTRDKKIQPERAERILRQVALALAHAHGLGLVHRDVKPENILIDQDDGTARLTDFGVARALEHTGELTQAGVILGSPRYMSPEQASGEPTIDGRSDLYSLALVGYEMFTGEPVIKSSSVAGMLAKHLTETPAPLATRASLPPNVAAAIDKGLAKDPADRWQTGLEFARALAGSDLTPTGEVRAMARPAPGSRGKRLAVAAGALVVAVAAGWFLLSRGGSTGDALLVAPFEIQSGDQSVAWLREGSVNMLDLTFGQWTDLNVVDYERTLSLLDAAGLGTKARLSLDDALLLARQAKAGRVVTGQVQTTHDSLIVVAKLYDVRSGKSTNQAQEGASLGDDPRPLFDRLAQQLLSIAGGRTSSMQLAQATTTSLTAYRAYLDGVKHLNAWRLAEADSEFARAIALDSTFALAYHKRSLGLGWSQENPALGVATAERAFALSTRLPPRERTLVEGHYHLTNALKANGTRDTAGSRVEYAASIRAYQDLISRGDSLTAEGWYGLADAYYHARFGVPGMPNDSIRVFTTRSLRDFNRTLAIDSTYHLAYSHIVELYTSSANGNFVLISGDSALLVTDSADVRRLGGPVAVQKLRTDAGIRGVQIAKAWARSDSDSPRPILLLAQSYMAARHPDSAIAVLTEAVARTNLSSPTLRLTLLTEQLASGDSGVAATIRYILDRFTSDSLRTIASGSRFSLGGALITATGVTGRGADLDRATALLLATDSVFPTTTFALAPIQALRRLAMHVGLGDSITPEVKKDLLQGIRWMDTLSGNIGTELRNNSTSIPYLAYLTTRDTVFSAFLQKWSRGPFPEIDAMVALSRGDTAEARRLSQAIPRPDSLRKPEVRFGSGGLRSVARAIVWESLGSPRTAAETYEAVTLPRINLNTFAEPGYAIWIRDLLAQARIWASLGETSRAVAAYQDFIDRWKDADGVAAQQVKEAVQELARLKDAPRKP